MPFKRYTFTRYYLTGNLQGQSIIDSFVAESTWDAEYRRMEGQEFLALSTGDRYRITKVEVSEPDAERV